MVSGESPAASIPHTCSTASRRPLIIGFPPNIPGLIVILSNSLSSSMFHLIEFHLMSIIHDFCDHHTESPGVIRHHCNPIRLRTAWTPVFTGVTTKMGFWGLILCLSRPEEISMIGAESEGSPPGGVLFRTSRTCGPEIQAHGAKFTRPDADAY